LTAHRSIWVAWSVSQFPIHFGVVDDVQDRNERRGDGAVEDEFGVG